MSRLTCRLSGVTYVLNSDTVSRSTSLRLSRMSFELRSDVLPSMTHVLTTAV
jgi:hypothetical protein